MKKLAFGQKSEKTKQAEVSSEQLSLFNEAETEQSTAEREDEKEITVKGYSKKKKRTRDEIFKDLPVEEVVHEVEDKICPECDTEMQVIGKEYVTKSLNWKVNSRIYRKKKNKFNAKSS